MKLLIILCVAMLSACSHIRYTRTFPDGSSIDVVGIEFGVDKALSGFNYESDSAKVSIEGLNQNQTAGLTAIVEGAVKGAVKGVSP